MDGSNSRARSTPRGEVPLGFQAAPAPVATGGAHMAGSAAAGSRAVAAAATVERGGRAPVGQARSTADASQADPLSRAPVRTADLLLRKLARVQRQLRHQHAEEYPFHGQQPMAQHGAAVEGRGDVLPVPQPARSANSGGYGTAKDSAVDGTRDDHHGSGDDGGRDGATGAVPEFGQPFTPSWNIPESAASGGGGQWRPSARANAVSWTADVVQSGLSRSIDDSERHQPSNLITAVAVARKGLASATAERVPFLVEIYSDGVAAEGRQTTSAPAEAARFPMSPLVMPTHDRSRAAVRRAVSAAGKARRPGAGQWSSHAGGDAARVSTDDAEISVDDSIDVAAMGDNRTGSAVASGRRPSQPSRRRGSAGGAPTTAATNAEISSANVNEAGMAVVREIAGAASGAADAAGTDVSTFSRPYVCQVFGCGRAFKRFEHLKRHHKTHSGERSFACSLCAKTFSRSDNYRQHMDTHRRSRSLAAGSPPRNAQVPVEHPVGGRQTAARVGGYSEGSGTAVGAAIVHTFSDSEQPCPVPGCEHIFLHAPMMQAHMMSVHGGGGNSGEVRLRVGRSSSVPGRRLEAGLPSPRRWQEAHGASLPPPSPHLPTAPTTIPWLPRFPSL